MQEGIIYKQIAEIMREVSPVSKDRKNTQQNYSFRGIDDAMNMLSPLMAKHGVFAATRSIDDVANEGVVSKQGSAGWRCVRRYTFEFFAEDGSSVTTTVDGEAIDYGDKSSNKAYSTAYREALWKLFVVPFASSDDIENHEHDIKPVETLKSSFKAPKPANTDKVARPTYDRAVEAIKALIDVSKVNEMEQFITNHAELTETQKASLLVALDHRAELISFPEPK